MATPAGNSKMKPVCNYGENCYRKNPDHLRNFSHPGREDDETEVTPKKEVQTKHAGAAKNTLDQYFKRARKEHDVSDSDSEEGSHIAKKKKIQKGQSPSRAKVSEKGDGVDMVNKPFEDIGLESAATSHSKGEDTDSEEDADINATPPPSPVDEKENISSKFLVKMPDDFFKFWEFCQSIDNGNPQGALEKTLKLKLVGPFDILSGRHKKVTKNKRGKRPNFLLHFRYFYDPPEFLTILAASNRSNLHFGYFRDDPKEDPVFVAYNDPDVLSGKEKITASGDNLFAAVHIYAAKMKKSASVHDSKAIEKLINQIEKNAQQHGFSLSASTKKMKERQKKVVCATFHGAGMVVPVDENEVGYRPVPETPGSLRTMLKKIADSPNKDERERNSEELQDLITLIQFANDECDFGEGLELGLDLFSYGRKCFHPQITVLLPLAYQFLRRNEFAEICTAHLKRRRTLDESVDELEV